MVSMTKGKHNLSLGGEFALDKTMFLANLNNYGDVTFATSAPTSTGIALADFITGQISSFEQDTPYVTHLSTWHTRRLRRTTTASRPVSQPILDFAGTSIRLLSMPITGPSRSFPASNPPLAPGSAGGPAIPWGQGHRSRHRQHAVQPHFASCRFCMGSVWGRQDLGSRGGGHLLRLPSGNEWNQPGNAMPFAIRNSFGPTPSLTNIYGIVPYGFPSTAAGGGIFPYTYTPSAPKFYPQPVSKPSAQISNIPRSTSSTSACSGNCLTR